MRRGVENLMRLAGLKLADAIRMATINAAGAGRLPGRSRGLVAGDRADILQFRMNGGAIEILALWVGGRRIEKDGSATS
jgi:adenine deaminase